MAAPVVHVSYLSFLTARRELAVGADPGPGTTPSGTIPLDPGSYEPEDVVHYLPDEAIRGAMVHIYNEVAGVEDATFTYGGPAYLDNDGYLLDNVFGDLSSTGTSAGGSVTTLAMATIAGATSATVASSTGFAIGNSVQIDTGSIAEVVTLTAAAANNLTFTNTPLRFAHASGTTASVVAGPFTHVFNALNSGQGQPPTHSLIDFNGITPSVSARTYVSACASALDFTGNSEGLFMWKATGSSWISAPSSTTPTAQSAFVVPVPNWRAQITVGGATVNSIGEFALSIKRPLKIYWTAQNSQNPYFIVRGPLDCTGTLNYTVAQDETPLNLYLNNTEPDVNISIDNGLSGTSHLKFTIDMAKAAFVKSKITRNSEAIGFNDEIQTVANSTNVGGSGGLGPCTVTVINNIPTY